MTKTSENRGKNLKMLGLIACLGALPLLFGATGCSSARPAGYTQTHNNDAYKSFVGQGLLQAPQ